MTHRTRGSTVTVHYTSTMEVYGVNYIMNLLFARHSSVLRLCIINIELLALGSASQNAYLSHFLILYERLIQFVWSVSVNGPPIQMLFKSSILSKHKNLK